MIQLKLKECSECKKLMPIWKTFRDEDGNKKMLCRYHAQMKTAKKQIEEGKASKQVYDDFSRKLWKERKHVSELSGTPLPEYNPHDPKFCNLIRYHQHHFWAKSKHPELMFDASNIVFLTKQEHEIVEWGSENDKQEIGWNKFVQNRNQ